MNDDEWNSLSANEQDDYIEFMRIHEALNTIAYADKEGRVRLRQDLAKLAQRLPPCRCFCHEKPKCVNCSCNCGVLGTIGFWRITGSFGA